MSSEPQRPTGADPNNWRAYWEAKDQPWRTEPEIDEGRQRYLAEGRSIEPDIARGVYPFKGVVLTRADVEWLLVTHRSGRWPSEWTEVNEGETKRGLDLRGAVLVGVDLHRLPLYELRGGLEASAWFTCDDRQRDAAAIDLRHANLSRTRLQGASLRSVHLEGTALQYAHLEGASLRGARLQGADLRSAYVDRATGFNNVTLGSRTDGVVRVADTRWDDTNLAVVNWATIPRLGDELEARRRRTASGEKKNHSTRLEESRAAVRANRQLATALRAQGLNENADHFAFRSHLLQRRVVVFQLIAPPTPFPIRDRARPHKNWLLRAMVLAGLLLAWPLTLPFRLHPIQRLRFVGAILLSAVLGLLAGHGYRPGRSFLAYALVITAFAAAFVFVSSGEGVSLTPFGATVLSVTSFHGRGAFPGLTSDLSPGHVVTPDDPLSALAAIEGFIGLTVEVSLIATFSRRFFEK